MIILGIDPGIATLGYGVVDKDRSGNCRAIDYGVVLTPKEETLPVRLAILEEGVNRVLTQKPHHGHRWGARERRYHARVRQKMRQIVRIYPHADQAGLDGVRPRR